MTKKSRLQIQQKIDVMLLPEGEWFQSMVQEMDEGTVSITIPIRNGQYLLLQPWEEVRVEFAVKDAIYRFESQVLGRSKSNNVPLIVLKRPAQYSRQQRRSFVRLPVVLPVEYQISSQKEESGLVEVSETLTGKTVDISGGGLQMYVSNQASRGDTIQVSIQLDDGNQQALALSGLVSWVKKDEHSGAVRLGVDFAEISESDQERIIAFIFSMMRRRTQA